MNNAIKSSVASPRGPCAQLQAAFFHSTPVLERRRRTHWESRSNNYTRRFRQMQSKQSLLRNVNAYADFIFKRWEEEADEDDPFSSRSSWFGQYWNRGGSRRDRKGKRSNQRWGGKDFQFCEEDIDVETIFRSAFGGTRCFYWSFVDDEHPRSHWRSWTSNGRQRYGNWGYFSEEEYESSPESDRCRSQLTSDRLALGLSTSGPLKLDDVKNAYRACALKWHPDRHQGSSKVVAEEKFKACSAAYQSLCDKLAVE